MNETTFRDFCCFGSEYLLNFSLGVGAMVKSLPTLNYELFLSSTSENVNYTNDQLHTFAECVFHSQKTRGCDAKPPGVSEFYLPETGYPSRLER